MTIVVEAGSLSTINKLASNPPAFLEDIRHHSLGPLVLYIARVPGSRDVFLTPIKPREKIVTAQDIQSSLYYIHSNNEDDTDLVIRAHEREQLPPDELRAISRLPDHETGLETDPYALSWSRQPSIRRKPVLTDVTNRSAVSDIPLLPPRPLPKLPLESKSDGSPGEAAMQHNSSPLFPITPSEAKAMESLSGSLTLIRRDPATAEQWNVAIIEQAVSDDQASVRSSISSLQQLPRRRQGRPLQLSIMNPAYDAFHDGHPDPVASTTAGRIFSRILRVPHEHTAYFQTDMSRDSRASFSSDDKQYKRRSRFLPDQVAKQDQARYSFISPWNDICKFTTAATGRALSCTHRSREVSELRFNLPLTSGKSTTSSSGSRQSRLENLRHSIKPAKPPPNSAAGDSDASDDDGMDLSLGREKAGGGFGGKQAKLGKLIIHAEGLPMLDLLVAANMGLWWRAWERTE